MQLRVRVDDLTSCEVQKLVTDHLAALHSNSPPGQVNALALEALRKPEITFWTAWLDDQLCGCGALQQLSATSGEIKSMHTRPSFQRRGVGQAVLNAILRAAREFDCDALYNSVLVRMSAMESAHHEDGTDSASLTVSVRLPESLPPQAARAWLAEHAAATEVLIEGEIPAWSGPRHGSLARTLQRSILQAGGKPRAVRKTGTADLNLVAPAWACPSVAYGPGDAALDHTPEEHIVLEDFRRGTDVLAGALTVMKP